MKYLFGKIQDQHLEVIRKEFMILGYEMKHLNSEEILVEKYNPVEDKRMFKNQEDLLKLKHIICEELDIDDISLPGTSIREKKYTMARHIFYSILRADKHASLDEIGKLWGVPRDHATILNATRVIDFTIFTKDWEYYPPLQSILQKIGMDESLLILKKNK